MSVSYDRINIAFERAVIQLQDNLQYLADNGKVSSRFIAKQNNIIKAIINYQHQTENLVGHLEWELLELTKGKIQEIERLKEIRESLEAICIAHGIMDFPMWMAKGNNLLVNQAIYAYREKTITLPILLKEKFDQLPKEEKKVLDKILYKGYHNEIVELEQQLEELKAKQNDIKA
jgi:hypothetical protein